MPDEIEVAQDGSGRAAFAAFDGQPAWHRLGELRDEPAGTDEALKVSHCAGWNVHKVKIFGQKQDKAGITGRTINFAKDFGTVRTNPFTGELEGLGTVGKLWTPVQNEEAAALGDMFMEELGGAKWHTMGSLEDGRKVFMSLKLPDGVRINGEDQVDIYLIIANAHDGTGALMLLLSPVRPVCGNTLDMAIKAAKQRWSLRHVGDMEEKMEVVRDSLSLSFRYIAEFVRVAEKMAADLYSDDDMLLMLKQLIPDPKGESEGWRVRAEGQRHSIMDLFKNAPTCEFARGTKWAAYNAVAEYADWHRSGSPERIARESLGIGVNQPLKNKSLVLMGVR